MGLLTEGIPMSWHETVPFVDYIKVRSASHRERQGTSLNGTTLMSVALGCLPKVSGSLEVTLHDKVASRLTYHERIAGKPNERQPGIINVYESACRMP